MMLCAKGLFDNNIVANLQKGNVSLPNLDYVTFYGSFAHFEELIESGSKRNH